MKKATTWANIGTEVENAKNMKNVLKRSGLDYTVTKQPVFLGNGAKVPGKFATVNDETNSVFGIVGNDYRVLQNLEAFDFADNLIDKGMTYERAGQTENGLVYIIASMPEYHLFGDEMKTYLIFQNSHDGTTPIKVAIVPLRIVCQNQFNVAFKNSDNTIVIRHTDAAEYKLVEAKRVFQETIGYHKQFKALASEMQEIKLAKAQTIGILEKMFPVSENDGAARERRMIEARTAVAKIFVKDDDLQNNRNNGWGLLNAYSDYMTHSEPVRKTENWEESKFRSVTLQKADMNKMVTLIKEAA